MSWSKLKKAILSENTISTIPSHIHATRTCNFISYHRIWTTCLSAYPSFPAMNKAGILTLRPVSSLTISMRLLVLPSSSSEIITKRAPASSATSVFVRKEHSLDSINQLSATLWKDKGTLLQGLETFLIHWYTNTNPRSNITLLPLTWWLLLSRLQPTVGSPITSSTLAYDWFYNELW